VWTVCSPRSRHYTLDQATGTIAFGDGHRGFVPPALPHGIVATRYRIGGGAVGNVGANTLTSLGRALAYIATVANPLPAGGGADRETIDEAKARAPDAIRNRDRAVTADDYEALALRASTALGRARCVADPTGRTGVTIAVVPRMDSRDADLARRLVPSPEVLRQVTRYLDDRRLIGTTLAVVRPRYRDLAVRVVLAKPAVTERLDHDVAAALRRHLHALVGGEAGSGWEFGRAVVAAELARVVEQVDGVDGVVAIELRDDGRAVATAQVRLDDDQLPFVARSEVVGRGADDEELR
jgi:predicted phage baseplate assembly protein